jgi:hypothetical protein
MATKRETILARILTVVTPTTGVSNRVYRDRVVAFTREESPGILIEAVSDNPTQATSLPTLDWSMTVRCSVIIRSSTPITSSDPVIENMHSRLMADLTLNGNAIDIEPSNVSWEVFDADQPGAVISCDYLVRYRTQTTDLSQ